MPVTTFAAPILPGKTESLKQAAQEMADSRKNEYEESRHRMGVTREIASLQSTPQGDWVVVEVDLLPEPREQEALHGGGKWSYALIHH